MNISICDNNHEYIHNQHIPLNAWYGCDERGWWFCTVHRQTDDGFLYLRRFDGEHWIKVREKSPTTKNICQWATTKKLWWTKCHWFKEEDSQKRLVAKQNNHVRDIQSMMKHERKRKTGGSGIRLDIENYYADKTITDYECTKTPMHDFQRYYV